MNDDKQPDEIDAAIDATEPEPAHVMRLDATLNDGRKIAIAVPHPFGSDEFESAVSMLIQLRFASDQKTAAESPIVTPKRPTLVTPDGRALS